MSRGNFPRIIFVVHHVKRNVFAEFTFVFISFIPVGLKEKKKGKYIYSV
jgi:hypothetical protein